MGPLSERVLLAMQVPTATAAARGREKTATTRKPCLPMRPHSTSKGRSKKGQRLLQLWLLRGKREGFEALVGCYRYW